MTNNRFGDGVSPALRTSILAWVTARVVVAVAWLGTGTGWFRGFETEFAKRSDGLFLWDGAYYRDLAEHGYRALDPDAQRFFPLYHLLGRWVGFVFGGNDQLGLIVVANAASLVALWLLYVIAIDLGAGERIAARSVWWLALFPAAPVLVWAYSESLAIALGLAAVWAFRRGWFLPSALCAMGVGLTRSVGAAVAVVFAVAILTEWSELRANATWRGWIERLAVVAAAPIGFAVYFVWLRATFGSWDVPLEAQRQFRAGWRDPLTRLIEGVIDVASGSADNAFNVAFAMLCIAALVLTWRRIPIAGWSYVAVTLAIVLAANNIDSLGRYVLAAFPLAAMCAVAEIRLAGDRRWVAPTVSTVSALSMVAYCWWAWSGRMIP